MPKVSINILTKNRLEFLKKALESIEKQSFKDFEIILVDDGSTLSLTPPLIKGGVGGVRIINHKFSLGITQSRQEALLASQGEYIAILDDDDEWIDADKLKKQAEFLDNNPEMVLTGGSIETRNLQLATCNLRTRPQSDRQIRRTMLFRNNFFTSTVMFRKDAAIRAGGFIKHGLDLAEDYDLWLRLGNLGKMNNFCEVFTVYSKNSYNKEKFRQFLNKQLQLIGKHCNKYPYFAIAWLITKLRLLLSSVYG